MSLINFICPDGGKIPVKNCLSCGGCRMGERCATRPYLMMAASERPQTFRCNTCGTEAKFPAKNKSFSHPCIKLVGPDKQKSFCPGTLEYLPSTTQLIQGTKAAFLKLTCDFDISPDSRAFMITGTKGHAALEAFDDDYSLAEEKFAKEDISGIADLLTDEDGQVILSDYKVSGSFKVAKALGFEEFEEATGEFFKSGKRKGEEKTRKGIRRNAEAIDRWEWEMQLNKYRINYERMGFKVDKLKIQCVVRDGGTFIARSRGVFRNVYYFDINILPDEVVNEFFDRKRRDLLQALKQGYWAEVCTGTECWDGLKCASYCEVADHCPQGKYLKREKEKENDMPIKGLSEARRLPRMGKIRLGILVERPGKSPYPKEVKHLILDPAVANDLEKKKLLDVWEKNYGTEPTSVDIMFPVADLEQIFPQYYKSYGSGTLLKCKGDGEIAETNDPEYIKNLKNVGQGDFGTKVECRGKDCPYFKDKKCSAVATLSVLLPALPGSGVWQVTTGSIHSILNLNSCFDYIRAIAGRFHMIPLKLERREQEIQFEGKKTKHYVLHINLELALKDLQRRALIDPVKSAMELPAIANEKIDLYLEHNETINPENMAHDVEAQEAVIVDPALEQAPLEQKPAVAATEQVSAAPMPAAAAPAAITNPADIPWPEQEELELTIEAAIKEAETIEALQKVKDRFEKNFVKGSTDLTLKQRENLNRIMRKRTADINAAKSHVQK